MPKGVPEAGHRFVLPRQATEAEVYELGLKYLKWVLTSRLDVPLAERTKAATAALRLRPALTAGDVQASRHDIAALMERVFGEPAAPPEPPTPLRVVP